MMGFRAGIAERRLRPLWDAIDTRQYKQALKLATTLQAKHPDSSYLLALKALVLERTGKSEEASLLCQQARDSGPVDEMTLNTLQTVYTRLHLLHEATACYEYACSKVTRNVELLMALFKCYVRQYVYVKQQQTAMKLYKQIGEERFLLWGVCSILMQVGSEDGGGNKLLALAEALLRKRVDANGLHDLEALMLYISVLQQQGKHEGALNVLSGNLGDLFSIQSDKFRLQGELLMSTQQYDKAAELFESILRTSPDDWGVFLSYLDASLGRYDFSQSNSSDVIVAASQAQEDQVNGKLDKILKLVEELQGMDSEDLQRGPFLAVVEIEKKRIQLKQRVAVGKRGEQSGPLVDAILTYFNRFGHLSSFSSDMLGFVAYVDEMHKSQLATGLHEASCRVMPASLVKQLRYKVAAFQMEEQLRVKLKLSNKDLVAHAVEIVKLYLDSLELSADLDAQESMHGEELLVLSTNLLIEVFRRTQHLGYLLEAVLILEFGLYARRYSSQYKLLLINLYSLLSAVAPALEWYRTLDVKFILIETLSHCMLPGMLGSTLWTDLQGFLSDALKFYDHHQMESADLTILAYQHCTYSKILEFVEFKERLERSHQHLVFRLEAAILGLKQKADNLEEFEFGLVDVDFGKRTLEWSDDKALQLLSFNEDLETRPWWSPAPDVCYLTGSLRGAGAERSWHNVETAADKIKRESEWRAAVRRRCLVPRILYLVLNSVTDNRTVGENGGGSSMDELHELLQEYLKTLNLDFEQFESWLQAATYEERQFQDSQIDTVGVTTVTVFWASYHVTLDPSGGSSRVASLMVQFMEKVINDLQKQLVKEFPPAHEDKDSANALIPGTAAFDLVNLTSESFAWLGLYLQAWARRLQPVPKKKKKGTGVVDQNEPPVAGHLSATLGSMKNACVGMLEQLRVFLSDYLSKPVDEEVHALLSLLGPDCETPGALLATLEGASGIASKLAARTTSKKQPWETTSYVRNLVKGQRATLLGIQDLCTMRLKVFRSLKF